MFDRHTHLIIFVNSQSNYHLQKLKANHTLVRDGLIIIMNSSLLRTWRDEKHLDVCESQHGRNLVHFWLIQHLIKWVQGHTGKLNILRCWCIILVSGEYVDVVGSEGFPHYINSTLILAKLRYSARIEIELKTFINQLFRVDLEVSKYRNLLHPIACPSEHLL